MVRTSQRLPLFVNDELIPKNLYLPSIDVLSIPDNVDLNRPFHLCPRSTSCGYPALSKSRNRFTMSWKTGLKFIDADLFLLPTPRLSVSTFLPSIPAPICSIPEFAPVIDTRLSEFVPLSYVAAYNDLSKTENSKIKKR